ncbi:MAG: Smr/MutS family protein [bacterium]
MSDKRDDEKNRDDDASLFREALGDVTPLKHDRATPYKQRRRPEPLGLGTSEDEGDEFADTAEEAPPFLEFKRSGVQNRVYQDLGRGLIPPEETLDLHGMRVVDARKALARFLANSLHHSHRCVRIIHGKGQGSANQQPVLKQRVNQWLKQHDGVLAFRSAPRWDGGTGAVYVLLSLKWGGFD